MKEMLFLLLISVALFAQTQFDFAIYHDGDDGAWEGSVIAFEQFLNWKGVTHNRVTAADINKIVLKDIYKAIYFPGGDADYFNEDINSTGIKHIQELVTEGGAYVGICAGAEFACDKLIWERITIDYPLNLFKGEAVGPIDELAVWPRNAMTTVNMNLREEINRFEPAKHDMLYWGGTIFSPYAGMVCDTIATYDKFYDRPAIVKFAHGQGRVLLIGPHPEIEEDSNRDGNNEAEKFSDNGSDWNFLWTATDWLLGNPLSHPTKLTTFAHLHPIKMFPNTTNGIVFISNEVGGKIKKMTIFNPIGQMLLAAKPVNNILDLSALKTGMYIIEVEMKSMKIKKVPIIRE